jgi:hypothetical protein
MRVDHGESTCHFIADRVTRMGGLMEGDRANLHYETLPEAAPSSASEPSVKGSWKGLKSDHRRSSRSLPTSSPLGPTETELAKIVGPKPKFFPTPEEAGGGVMLSLQQKSAPDFGWMAMQV